MSMDISKLLNEWPHEPDAILVRIIAGDDGHSKLQLRVDLGVLQMELDGRPDGLRPEGRDSWLEYYELAQREHDERKPDGPPFRLSPSDCERLGREGIQYYHRFLSFWHLELYELCARDTNRNLRLFAFVREYAGDDQIKLQFDQWRPYVLMMHTRAVATPLVEQKEFAEGLRTIESAIDSIRDFFDERDQADRAEECAELKSLEQWRDEILSREDAAAEAMPEMRVRLLRQRLDEAISAENFEEAAKLRDEINRLGGEPSDSEE